MANNFKKTGDLYVSKSGSNANAGTDPNAPLLTIESIATKGTTDNIGIIGDGIYQEKNIELTARGFISDGLVICESDGTIDPFFINFKPSLIHRIEGLIFVGFINVWNNPAGSNRHRSNFINDCVFFGGSIGDAFDDTESGNPQSLGSMQRNRYINATHTLRLITTSNIKNFRNNIYEGNFQFIVTGATSFLTIASNCHFGANGIISLQNLAQAEAFSFSNINCPIIINGVNYASLEEVKNIFPTAFPNCINQPPLFNRLITEAITLDFTVQGASPLLGAGENGTNIGGVKRGIPSTRLSDSVVNGVNENIVFDGNVWQVQNGNTTGRITSDVIDFGLTIKSPTPTIKGIVNFLDNVPDFDNALLNPNKLNLEIRYAIIGEDISAAAYKPFLFNEPMLLDTTGKSNGEAGFDWDDTVTIPIKQIQYRITLRQDYDAG
jgi:hypothetical protein